MQAIIHRPGRIASLSYDYKRAFLEDLEEYRIMELSEPYDEQIYNLIHEMIPLRNNYIKFIELLCSNHTLFDTKTMIDFLKPCMLILVHMEQQDPFNLNIIDILFMSYFYILQQY